MDKIESLIHFWERFKLSLPGRISIIKTLLVPQLNYLGCILTPSDTIVKNIQLALDSFALKGIVVSTDRRYLLPEQGGVGLFRIEEFLFVQKCSWIKRILSNQNDNWRLTMMSFASSRNIEHLRSCDIDPNKHFILYDVAAAFELFVSCFSLIDNNYRKNSIFANGAFHTSGQDPRPLGIDFFGRKFYESNSSLLRTLTFDDCFNNSEFKSINEFSDLGLRFPASLWMKIRSALFFSKNKLTFPTTKEGRSVGDFLRGFRKSSKPFRITINNAGYIGESPDNLTVVSSFSNITNTLIHSIDCLPHVLSSWNRTFWDNHFREFIFKCSYNSLRTKDRLSHFLQLDDVCNFCKNIVTDFKQRETFPHKAL